MKIGLVLSGGGARGVAHIGVIKALEEIGLTFSGLAGSSAGAIVAAMYASGQTPDKMVEIIQKISIFKFRPSWTRAGFLKMDGLRDLLGEYIPGNSFESLKIPLAIAATDIRLGKIHYFTEGELIPAVMASCCVPAVFPPISFNGGLYIDGGVLDNLPVRALHGKYDFMIGSDCNQIPQEFDPKSIKTVLERTLLIGISTNTMTSKALCDVVITPPLLGRFSAVEIGKAREIFDLAYSYTLENFTKENFTRTSDEHAGA